MDQIDNPNELNPRSNGIILAQPVRIDKTDRPREANLVHVQEIYRALAKAGSEKEPEHKTHTTKQSQSKSRRD